MSDEQEQSNRPQILQLMRRYRKPIIMAGMIAGGMAMYGYFGNTCGSPPCNPHWKRDPTTGQCTVPC